ncbi:MAG: hypothetical protein AAFQ58_22415 [Pseudomonadota bacterium]
MDKRYKIKLLGAFDICNSLGAEVPGLGKKSQAIVAILSLYRNRWVTRSTIQDLLWSDRGAEHGGNSLRKALSQIRKITKPFSLIEERSGGYVRISQDVALVDLFEPDEVWAGESNFDPGELTLLEGLDVRDNEFDAWLHQQRLKRPNSACSGPQERNPQSKSAKQDRLLRDARLPRVALKCTLEQLCLEDIGSVLSHDLARQSIVTAFLRADIAEIEENESAFNETDAFLEFLVSKIDDKQYFRIFLRQAEGHSAVWSDFQIIDRTPKSLELAVYEMAERAVEAVFSQILNLTNVESERILVGLNACRALSGLFNVGTSDPQTINSNLDVVQLHRHGPRTDVWRAAVSAMKIVEQPECAEAEEIEKIEAHLRDALQHGSNDSTVLAVAGHLYGRVIGDQTRALALTSRAVERDRRSAFSWLFRASSLYRVNDLSSASFAATQAFQLGANSFADAFFSSVRSYTSLANRDFDSCIRYGERLRSSPARFRSNARVLAAAYGHIGDIAAGRRVVADYCGSSDAIDDHLSADKALRSHSELGELVISKGLSQLQ